MDNQVKSYVKIYRDITDWRWYKDTNTKAVFFHLILRANIRPHDFQNITVGRGELITSYPSLSEELGMSIQNVRTAISHLKKTGEITVTPYSKFSLIAINTFDLYQDRPTDNQQSSNRQLTGNQQSTNNNQRMKRMEECIFSSELSGESPDKKRKPPSFDHEDKPYRLAVWLDRQIKERLPHYKEKTEMQLQKWSMAFDRMNRLDGIPWDEMRDVLAFSQQDDFWNANILSADKFRDKFTQLSAQMQRKAARDERDATY